MMNFFGNEDAIIEDQVQADNKADGKGTTMFEKTLGGKNSKLVTRDFLKKYISFVKS